MNAVEQAIAVIEREETYAALLRMINNPGLDERVRWMAFDEAASIRIRVEIEESKGLDS